MRETTSQALAVVLRPMCAAAAAKVAGSLLTMASGAQVWEVRHGALLGLKYVLSVRADLLPSLLPRAAPLVSSALSDADDDVRCVAADTLGSVAGHARSLLPPAEVARLLGALWDSLLGLDCLAASATAVMGALAGYAAALPYAALAAPECSASGVASLTEAVDRLWPVFLHPSAAARASAMHTLARLLTAAEPTAAGPTAAGPAWLQGAALSHAARLLLQAVALETSDAVQPAAQAAWAALLLAAPRAALRSVADAHRGGWMRMLGAPLGAALDLSALHSVAYACEEAGGGAVPGEFPFLESHATEGTRARGAVALGQLAHACTTPLPSAPATAAADDAALGGWREALLDSLGAASATRRVLAAWVLAEWSAATHAEPAAAPARTALGPECAALHAAFRSVGVAPLAKSGRGVIWRSSPQDGGRLFQARARSNQRRPLWDRRGIG